ncbi:MAG: VWA domain-containing protein [Flavobacteriales bacterium]|nr:VWA domain-containing protein [Flavobacteriales bacterium]
MFLQLFYALKHEGIPVSLREYLTLLEAVKAGLGENVDDFYSLARTILIKHEEHLDRFDAIFSQYVAGSMKLSPTDLSKIQEDWLKYMAENNLTDEEKAMIEAMGGLEELAKRFQELLEEQKERHQGGSKWIGTAGTSPFGAYGYNPAGYRVGQAGSRNRSAVKVWDKREFKDLSDKEELNTRNLKMALRRLRVFTRLGHEEELDLDSTIKKTSKNAGFLQIEMRPERKNNVKVLMLFDIGGTMDDHVDLCSKLFSAAKYEFKHLEFYYFHNCLYERLWKENRRRFNNISPTFEVMNKFNDDYRLIIVGDASMSPWEILQPGGSVEHNNPEAGLVWMERITQKFKHHVWINPNPEQGWRYSESTQIIKQAMNDRMFPLTMEGLSKAMNMLKTANKRSVNSTETEFR